MRGTLARHHVVGRVVVHMVGGRMYAWDVLLRRPRWGLRWENAVVPGAEAPGWRYVAPVGGSIQSICAKSGVILEAALDFLTIQYECQVPRRIGGRYVLSELLIAINGKLKAALRSEIIGLDPHDSAKRVVTATVQLAPILDEIARIAQVRNVMGCHFNEFSAHLLSSDALKFAELSISVLDCIATEDSGWTRSKKSGSYWSNSPETRRLHPLQRPS
jgi:hypothetical protein